MTQFKPQYCNIFLVDEFHILTDEIRDRFKNKTKYNLQIFSDIQKELQELTKKTVHGRKTRITVYVLNQAPKIELDLRIRETMKQIQSIDPAMNVLFVVKNNSSELIPKALEGADFAVIPNNENVILRITNYILGIISKENLEFKYRKAKRMAWILGLFLLGISLITLVFYFLYPIYF